MRTKPSVPASVPSGRPNGSDFARSVRVHPKAVEILKLDRSEAIPDIIRQALAEHRRLIAVGSTSVLKDAPESAVTRVSLPGVPPVCVKEFRWRGAIHGVKSLFRATQGTRTFANGWRLKESGFSAAAPLALVRERSMGIVLGEWVIMEIMPRCLELDRYLVSRIRSDWSPEEKRCLARMMGRYIGSLHSAGIFHADLKTCNILVSEMSAEEGYIEHSDEWTPTNPEGGLRFSLVDYDHVTFSNAVSPRKRIKNLVQIFLSMPTAVAAGDRLRFLHEYALHVGLSVAERRKTALQVLEAARGRDILYVGFDGDIVEQWNWSDTGDPKCSL